MRLVAWVAAAALAAPADFELPGSQPLGTPDSVAHVQHLFLAPDVAGTYGRPCFDCHAGGTFTAEPGFVWRGSMMSQAARDPVFYAQLDLTNHDGRVGGPRPEVAGMGDMCLRCHSPVGWLEGRSTDLTGQAFIQKDLHGVQCHVCHRLADPQTADDAGHPDRPAFLDGMTAAGLVPTTFGNGMYVVDPKQVRRGPYGPGQLDVHLDSIVGPGEHSWVSVELNNFSGDSPSSSFHPVMASPFHRSSNLCGTCHDVSNPIDCTGPKEDVQHCFPIERTWTEWRHSAFPAMGEGGTCQSCHMSGPLNGAGFGKVCEAGDDAGHLNDVHVHDLTGGNSFVPKAILYMKERFETPTATLCGADSACVAEEDDFKAAITGLYPPTTGVANPFAGVDAAALEHGIERVENTLRRAAWLEKVPGSGLVLRVTNRTGHRLPTGYPEGRRMWLRVEFLDAAGATLAVSGEYDAATGTLYHDQDLDPTQASGGALAYDRATYTLAGVNVPGGRPTKVWEARLEHAATGTEFHFSLNDAPLMDNRIPPEGWVPSAWAADRASPELLQAYVDDGWQAAYVDDGGTPADASDDVALHHEDVTYPVPAGTDRVRATLLYQTASREYVEALADDNPDTLTAGGWNRGTLLEHVWSEVGRSAPVTMASTLYAIVDTDGDGLSDGWVADFLTGATGTGPNDDPDHDGLSNAHEFQLGSDPQDVDDPGSPLGNRLPVDLVLVLDTSCSMNDPAPGTSTRKIEVLRRSVELFLQTWRDHARPEDRLGAVYFGSEAHAWNEPDPLLQPFFDTWEPLLADLVTKEPDGWTAMGAGLHTAMAPMKDAQQELIVDPANPRRHHLILFSDGMQNRSPMLTTWSEDPSYIAIEDVATSGEVTGGSNVVIGAGLFSGFPLFPNPLTVHTVGIGMTPNDGGTAWHTLLQQLAEQQLGEHDFILRSRELEGVFLEDLVASLRSNTLEYVIERDLLLGAEPVELPFEVTAAARKASIVLSYGGKGDPPPVVELVRPDGRLEPLGDLVRTGDGWAIVTRFFAAETGEQGVFGRWTLRLRHPLSLREKAPIKTPMPLLVHVVLDDAELKYTFDVAGSLAVGGRPLVTASARQGNTALRWMDRVEVTLDAPTAAVGTLLATARPGPAPALDADATAIAAHAAALAVLTGPAGAKLQRATRSLTLRDDGSEGDERAGDGVFSLRLPELTVPGHYRLRFEIVGHALDGGLFRREEARSFVVSIGALDPAASDLVRGVAGGVDVIEVSPRDEDGNWLGPGYGPLLRIEVDGVARPVEDLGGGRYRVEVPAGTAPDAPVRIVHGGTVWHDGPVPTGSRGGHWTWVCCLLAAAGLLLGAVVVVTRRRRAP